MVGVLLYLLDFFCRGRFTPEQYLNLMLLRFIKSRSVLLLRLILVGGQMEGQGLPMVPEEEGVQLGFMIQITT